MAEFDVFHIDHHSLRVINHQVSEIDISVDEGCPVGKRHNGFLYSFFFRVCKNPFQIIDFPRPRDLKIRILSLQITGFMHVPDIGRINVHIIRELVSIFLHQVLQRTCVDDFVDQTIVFSDTDDVKRYGCIDPVGKRFARIVSFQQNLVKIITGDKDLYDLFIIQFVYGSAGTFSDDRTTLDRYVSVCLLNLNNFCKSGDFKGLIYRIRCVDDPQILISFPDFQNFPEPDTGDVLQFRGIKHQRSKRIFRQYTIDLTTDLIDVRNFYSSTQFYRQCLSVRKRIDIWHSRFLHHE